MNTLLLDPDTSVPPFEQIRIQLAAAIQAGDLEPEVRLPTVRQLARDLGLAINTVARVYRELELAGLIETRGRHGSFVTGATSRTRAMAVDAAGEYVRRLEKLGIGAAEGLAIVRREIEAHIPTGQGSRR